MTRFIFFVIIGMTLNIAACKSQKLKINKVIFQNDTLLSKTISFPNNLLLLIGNEFKNSDSVYSEIKDEIKILSIIDGTCAKCIGDLNKLDSVFNCNLEGICLIFVLNVNPLDSAFFMYELQPLIKSKSVVLWDNSYHFERQNKLFTADPNLRTFMLNKENRIIHYGNPLMNRDVIFEYQEKFESEYFKD